MTQARILLTGATGFVGRQVLQSLLQAGCQVRVTTRGAAGVEVEPGAERVAVDDLFSASDAQLRDLCRDMDGVIHSAWYAEPGKYLHDPLNLQCLSGTLNLGRAALAEGVRRFVGIGTCFEYDLSAGVLRPETRLSPQTIYAACKASAYHVLANLFASSDVSFAWCRLFYLYGEGEDSRRLVPYLHARLSQGQPAELTSGTQLRDFIDVVEAGKRIASVGMGEIEGAVNICSGVPVTVRQLAESIADEYGRRDLLQFGARPDNAFDPPCVVGVTTPIDNPEPTGHRTIS